MNALHLTLSLGARALAMTETDAVTIVTLIEEPALILAAGEPSPCLDPLDVAAAYLRAAWMEAEMLNDGALARAAGLTCDDGKVRFA